MLHEYIHKPSFFSAPSRSYAMLVTFATSLCMKLHPAEVFTTVESIPPFFFGMIIPYTPLHIPQFYYGSQVMRIGAGLFKSATTPKVQLGNIIIPPAVEYLKSVTYATIPFWHFPSESCPVFSYHNTRHLKCLFPSALWPMLPQVISLFLITKIFSTETLNSSLP